MRLKHVLLLALFCGLACAGCRGLATRSAVDTISAMIADGLPAYMRETDLELAEPALAANVKFIEALLQTEPQHPMLLLHAAQGFATYAYAVVEGQLAEARAEAPSQVAHHRRRAQQLYRRGLHYGLRLLHRYHAARPQALSLDLPALTTHLQQLPSEAAPALFWTALCWGGMLNMARDTLDTIAALPRLETMLTRLVELDETYFYGAPHLLLAVHYASHAPTLGGNPTAAQHHFARARTFSQGRLLLVPLLEAQYYAVQVQDRALFQVRVQQVLDAPDTLFPEQALLNTVAKRRAALLLRRMDDLFV